MERLPSFVLSEYRISVFCLLKILCVVLMSFCPNSCLGMDVDVNNYVNEFQHFLLRTKEEYAYWTRNNASQILTQLEKLKTKANELVSDIEQKTKQREEEFKNFTNSDSLFLHLRAILINFQKLIQIIEQVTYRSIPW
jgi:hypothetical protein